MHDFVVLLERLLARESLSRDEAKQLLDSVIDGGLSHERFSAILIALRQKPECASEIAGFAECLLDRAIPVASSPAQELIDVCGTGGDSAGTFNISTAAAFVVAAAGQPVAKHGNGKISSRAGSFDVLAALDVARASTPEEARKQLAQFGICFLFAPAFHPALALLAPLRQALGVRTILNVLGPLVNPMRPSRQLVGVYHPSLLERMAEVLRERGTKAAMIVCSESGMPGGGFLDELSLMGPSFYVQLKDDKLSSGEITPDDHGLAPAALKTLQGGDARENSRIIVQILSGEKGPRCDVVLLNAGAALSVAGVASDLREGIERARDAIDSGRTLALLKAMGGLK